MLDSNATPRMVQRHYGSRDCRPLRELRIKKVRKIISKPKDIELWNTWSLLIACDSHVFSNKNGKLTILKSPLWFFFLWLVSITKIKTVRVIFTRIMYPAYTFSLFPNFHQFQRKPNISNNTSKKHRNLLLV